MYWIVSIARFIIYSILEIVLLYPNIPILFLPVFYFVCVCMYVHVCMCAKQWTQHLTQAKKALPLSCTTSPLYFETESCYMQCCLNSWFSYFNLPNSWDYEHAPSCPGSFVFYFLHFLFKKNYTQWIGKILCSLIILIFLSIVILLVVIC